MGPSAGKPIAAAKSRWNSSSNGQAPAKNGLAALALGHQLSEGRDVAVAFDQSRSRANAADQIFVKLPDVLVDRRIMAVDEQRAFIIKGVTGEVDLPDKLGRDRFEPGNCIVAEVVCA